MARCQVAQTKGRNKLNRILIAAAIAASVVGAAFGQGTNQSPVAVENIIGNIIASNPTVGGIVSNVVVESGAASTLKDPTKFSASISEAYPLIKVSYKAIVETVMFVHSTVFKSSVSEDEIGIGFNTFKRVTPKPVTVKVGSLPPIAHHGLFVNLVVGTSKAVQGRFDRADAGIQVGGFVSF